MDNKAPVSVSVIIPTFNSARFIEKTVGSVIGQTLGHWELIAVDDGSSDDTLDLLRRLAAADGRIKIITQSRGGVSLARNRGISQARGDFIAFLDHDDLWLPDKLEKQLRLFQKDDRVGLVFSRAAIINQSGERIGLTGGLGDPCRGDVFRELFSSYFIPISTAVVKKGVFKDLDEWFPEKMEMAEEIDLFLRIAQKWKVDYCGEILGEWRLHPGNDSGLRRHLLVKDFRLIIERLRNRIPSFTKDFEPEIARKERWIAVTEIEILVAEGNKKKAFQNSLVFFRRYGLRPLAFFKLVFLFIFGFRTFDRLRQSILVLYSQLRAGKGEK